jgi:hypothetical protein
MLNSVPCCFQLFVVECWRLEGARNRWSVSQGGRNAGNVCVFWRLASANGACLWSSIVGRREVIYLRFCKVGNSQLARRWLRAPRARSGQPRHRVKALGLAQKRLAQRQGLWTQ